VRREQRNESLKTLIGFLDHGVLETLARINGVTEDSVLSDSEKVHRIRALLADKPLAQSLNSEQLADLKATLVTEVSEEDYYLILSAKSVRLQNRVSPILKAVTFLTEPSAQDLHRAMEHFRLRDGAIDKSAPIDFLTPEDRAAVSRDGRFSVSLYKALLFLQVQSAIKSGTLNLEHSYKYRPLDAYLIDRERWQSIRIRCSRTLMRCCTDNTSPRTPTFSTGRTRTSNSRKWALRSAPQRWKRAMPRPCNTTFPSATSFR
jgi:hypothetical protein